MADDTIWVQRDDGDVIPYSEAELGDMGWELGLPQPIGGFIYSWDGFRSLPLPEAPFLVGGGVLPQRSKAVIYGDPKLGKSRLAMQMGMCVARGLPFLRFPTSQGRVLYVQLEMSYSTMQTRMPHNCPNIWVGTTFNMKLDRTEGFAKLDKAVEAVQPQLLIVDPFYKVFSGDENKVHDVQLVLDAEDRLIEKYNCSVLNLHHSRKPGEGGRGKGAYELRGTSQFIAWHESVMSLMPSNVGKCVLSFEAMRHAQGEIEQIHLADESDGLGFQVVGEEVVAAGSANKQERVEAWFKEKGGGTAGEAMKACECSRQLLHMTIHNLCRANQLERKTRGEYKWIGE